MTGVFLDAVLNVAILAAVISLFVVLVLWLQWLFDRLDERFELPSLLVRPDLTSPHGVSGRREEFMGPSFVHPDFDTECDQIRWEWSK